MPVKAAVNNPKRREEKEETSRHPSSRKGNSRTRLASTTLAHFQFLHVKSHFPADNFSAGPIIAWHLSSHLAAPPTHRQTPDLGIEDWLCPSPVQIAVPSDSPALALQIPSSGQPAKATSYITSRNKSDTEPDASRASTESYGTLTTFPALGIAPFPLQRLPDRNPHLSVLSQEEQGGHCFVVQLPRPTPKSTTTIPSPLANSQSELVGRRAVCSKAGKPGSQGHGDWTTSWGTINRPGPGAAGSGSGFRGRACICVKNCKSRDDVSLFFLLYADHLHRFVASSCRVE
ncbi:hypothetical protein QBC36DRAFT_375884 [Triangularia setosa]|uniref:Uncharacterized protein n=1 Tax=Triangularia setosa TaxID=2587417 RepID=A0AAN6WCM6_9PEZI|nr:hypothetical protein QBC36DRAFT_375884 [Podospora setosa]